MADPLHEIEELRNQVARIRASEIFTRSEVMRRLFDFLAESSFAGHRPKELEIAIDVFGRDASFIVVQDAVVRVGVHKLRRKLAAYYDGPGQGETFRVVIPRGEYRLVLEHQQPLIVADLPADAPVALAEPATIRDESRRLGRLPLIGGALLILCLNVAAWLALWPQGSPAVRELDEMRSHSPWREINGDALPVYLVIGDYYIFGELDGAAMDVRRLVRQFEINSRDQLEKWLVDNPQLADRYMDVSLQYLPISVVYALQHILPLLESNAAGRVHVVLASELTPATLKSAHVIYVGLLSGLGILRELAFTASQFQVGDSYDELIDRSTGKRYISEAGHHTDSSTLYKDYGYFSTMTGPRGNRVIIIAGTRDVAAMHTAEAVTHANSLKPLLERAGTAANFEALYAVQALDRTNIDGRLLFTKGFSKADWSSQIDQQDKSEDDGNPGG